MKATITSLIFLLLSLTVSSQTYKYIGIEEGLSNQKIYKIQKDARGYMWFLTHVGIDQYNGKEIKHYKLREGNRELDPLLNINWTFLDKTGTLLVTGKQGRIFRYDSGHDRFVQIDSFVCTYKEMFTVYLFYAGDISQSVRDSLLLSGFYVKKVDSRFAAQPYVILLVYVTISHESMVVLIPVIVHTVYLYKTVVA